MFTDVQPLLRYCVMYFERKVFSVVCFLFFEVNTLRKCMKAIIIKASTLPGQIPLIKFLLLIVVQVILFRNT